MDARHLSCQALQQVEADSLTLHANPHMPVTGYADEMRRRGEDHVFGCRLVGHVPDANA